MANVNQKLGKRIRSIRRFKKMTQEDLAYQAKIDYSYLNEIENAKRNPSTTILSRIARALKVPLSELFK